MARSIGSTGRRTGLTGLAALVTTAALLLTAGPGVAVDPASGPGSGPTSGDLAPAAQVDDGWRVLDGPAGAVATWTSATPLPVTSARPQVTLDGRPLQPVTLSADGLSLSVPAPTGTDPADLDVTLSGRSLDGGAAGTTSRRSGGSAAVAGADQGPDLGFDPATPGPHQVVESDYEGASLDFPGFPVPLEVTGHVVAPRASENVTGKPLVLFLHGRHGVCYDPVDPDQFVEGWPCSSGAKPIRSDLGYVYLQRRLATQGYTSVSISANGVNAQDYAAEDGGAQARAALVQRHLDMWADGEVPGAASVDLDRVVLVGHSRGGEGVDLAAQEIPASAPYRIAGEVLLGPTDFARRTAAYVPAATVLPYCDGDVSDLQGQLFTDTSRGLAPGDTALKSTLLVMGANHNFFNTEWTPGDSTAPSDDDWYDDQDPTCGAEAPDRLTPSEQRDVGTAYVAGAVATFTHEGAGSPQELAMFDGTPGHVASVGDAVVYSHAVGGGRTLVLPAATTVAGTGGATARICRGVADEGERTGCGAKVSSYRAPHWAPSSPEGVPTQSALQLSWAKVGAAGVMRLATALDLSDKAALDLRALADPATGTAKVSVRLEDATGAQATIAPTNGGVVRALPGTADAGLAKLVAQQLRAPLAGVTGVDLSRITAVSLVATSAKGKVWLLDLAATPSGLAAVPATRLPLLSMGDAAVQEAAGRGRRTVEVPYEISAPLAQPASFALVQLGLDGEATSRTVQLPAGSSSGTLEVPYDADRVYTGNRYAELYAFQVSGVGVRDGIGSATVTDDDARPKVRVRAPDSVREGQRIRITVELSQAAGIDVAAQPSFLRPELGPRAGVADLPRRWLRRYTFADTRRSPLWDRYVQAVGIIPSGERRVTITIPTRADGRAEGRERIRLAIEVEGLGFRTTRTVVLRDR